jgi:hypothetical protein
VQDVYNTELGKDDSRKVSDEFSEDDASPNHSFETGYAEANDAEHQDESHEEIYLHSFVSSNWNPLDNVDDSFSMVQNFYDIGA